MRNYLLYALGLLLWMGGLGCGPDEAVAPEMEEGRTARVSLSLGMEPMEGTTTRALAPHIPEVENLINDVWVVQFNAQGVRIGMEYYPREGEAGLYIENFDVELITAQNSTVCLVANTDNASQTWPNNFPAFRQMLLDIEASNDLSQRDRIPMCGYWVGDVTEGMSLSVMLCRMMTRINLVLNNATGVGLNDLTVALTNVPTEAYVFPATNQPTLSQSAYLATQFTDKPFATEGEGETGDGETEEEEKEPDFADGGSLSLYYYMAPNICEDGTYATTVTITATDEDGKERKWKTTLGTDAPGTAGRDFKLYANNFYTFTLNLTGGGSSE